MQNETSPSRLFSPPFVALVTAQLFSLFGEAVLRFALPLHVLNLTGSGTTYGLVVAAAFVPYILLTPIGGILADRVRKQHIMAALDALLAGTCLVYVLCAGTLDLIALTIGVLMILYAAQSIYQPSVQSSVPFLVATDKVTTGVGIVTEISTLTAIIGPVAGGLAFATAGIEFVVGIAAVAFAASCALIVAFARIPHVAQPKSVSGPVATAKADLAAALRFLKTRPIMGKCIAIVTLANLAIAAFTTVGTPYIVTEVLGLSNQLMGFAEAAMGAGGLIGGLAASALPQYFTLKNTPVMLAVAGTGLACIAAALALDLNPTHVYGVLLAALALVMAACTAFSVAGIAFLQMETTKDLVGKVLALTLSAANCATPLGQLIYGALFDIAHPALLAGAAALATIALCAALRRTLITEGYASRA